MEKQKKCFTEEHKDIDAISFCQECQIYMCNKCDNTHSSFHKNHHAFKLIKEEEIFTGYCKEKNHPIKLGYYCKNHNQLCCSICLCKLNELGDGQHKDCEVCTIENIKEEKKNKLKQNIKCLEDLSNALEQSINELKIIFNKINENKEELKTNIQNVFTKIRNALNNREDELLLEVDNKYNDIFGKEDIIKESEKLPNKIKLSLEKGKKIDNNWDDNELKLMIHNCIDIENNIKDIDKINENIKKCNFKNSKKIRFSPNDNEINNFIEKIKWKYIF